MQRTKYFESGRNTECQADVAYGVQPKGKKDLVSPVKKFGLNLSMEGFKEGHGVILLHLEDHSRYSEETHLKEVSLGTRWK